MSAAISYSLFRDQIKSISSERTRQIISSNELDQYQIIDVRQPGEYAGGHIPGSVLIPLGELAMRYTELDFDKDSIVYCRSGVRSKTACQILARLGIDRVHNMTGGITAYNGEQVEGNVEAGLEFFIGSDFDSAYELVFAMEAGLKNFYLTLADEAGNQAESEALTRLARFEDGHMKRLIKKFGEVFFNPDSTITEGGLDVEQMLAYFGEQLDNREKILQLAMKLEAQAFDLYSRLARHHKGEETETFYQSMAADEHQHLITLSKQLDNLL